MLCPFGRRRCSTHQMHLDYFTTVAVTRAEGVGECRDCVELFQMQFSSFQQRSVNFSGGYDLMTATASPMNVHNDAFVAQVHTQSTMMWCALAPLTHRFANAFEMPIVVLQRSDVMISVDKYPIYVLARHTLNCTQNNYNYYHRFDSNDKSQSFVVDFSTHSTEIWTKRARRQWNAVPNGIQWIQFGANGVCMVMLRHGIAVEVRVMALVEKQMQICRCCWRRSHLKSAPELILSNFFFHPFCGCVCVNRLRHGNVCICSKS